MADKQSQGQTFLDGFTVEEQRRLARPVEIDDHNNDEAEPGVSTIHQQVQIQQRQIMQQKEIETTKEKQQAEYQEIMAQQMANRIAREQAAAEAMAIQQQKSISVEYKSPIQQESKKSSNLNQRRIQSVESQPEQQERFNSTAGGQSIQEEKNKIQQYAKNDPKFLTRSTIAHHNVRASSKISAHEDHISIHQQEVLNQNKKDGYISDFYKNKQSPVHQIQTGDKSPKNGNEAHFGPPESGFSNTYEDNNGHHSSKFMKKEQSKKQFFQSKIDFSTPMNALQKQTSGNIGNNQQIIQALSDDESDNQEQIQQQTYFQPSSQLTGMNPSHPNHPQNSQYQQQQNQQYQQVQEFDNRKEYARQIQMHSPQFQQHNSNGGMEHYTADLPVQQMGGYSNLQLVKEPVAQIHGNIGSVKRTTGKAAALKKKKQSVQHVQTRNYGNLLQNGQAEIMQNSKAGGQRLRGMGHLSNMSPPVKNKHRSKLSLKQLQNDQSFSTITVAQARNAYMKQDEWDGRTSPSPLRLPGITNTKQRHVGIRKPSQLPQIHEGGTTTKVGRKFVQRPPAFKLPPATHKPVSTKASKGVSLATMADMHYIQTQNHNSNIVVPDAAHATTRQAVQVYGGTTHFKVLQQQSVQKAKSKKTIKSLNRTRSIDYEPEYQMPRHKNPGEIMVDPSYMAMNVMSPMGGGISNKASEAGWNKSQSKYGQSNPSGSVRQSSSRRRKAPPSGKKDRSPSISQLPLLTANQNNPQSVHNRSGMNFKPSPKALQSFKQTSTGSKMQSKTVFNKNQGQSMANMDTKHMGEATGVKHKLDPELLATEKELAEDIEEQIKDGFFELKHKFKEAGPSSIYISHVVLHEKHPIFCKLEVVTLKTLLQDSSVIYLSPSQTLYKYGVQDPFIYIVLFGRLSMFVPPNQLPQSDASNMNGTNAEGESQASNAQEHLLGRINIGWTLGEEILFDKNLQIRQERAVADTECCLIGLNKAKLAILQKNLLQQGNDRDYFVIESTLKGNFLVKDKWRKQYHEEEMAMLNNAAGEARTEILPPGTHSSRENESEEDDARRQAFPLHTLPPDASVESSRSSHRPAHNQQQQQRRGGGREQPPKLNL